jgi:hypothetical protein
MDLLMDTVRNEIADCLEKAYDVLSPKGKISLELS